MNTIIIFIVDGVVHWTKAWPNVPSAGDEVSIGIAGNPSTFTAIVKKRHFYDRPDGNQGCDLSLSRVPPKRAKGKRSAK